MYLYQKKKEISRNKLIAISSTLLAALYNVTFFKKVIEVYPLADNPFFLICLFFLLVAAFNLFLQVICIEKLTKPILIINVIVAALIAHVSSSFGTIMDETMILNMGQTETREVADLLTTSFYFYFLMMGLLPAFILWKLPLKYQSFPSTIAPKLKSITASIAVMILCLLPNGKSFASFFRQHKPLRYYTNPLYFYYSGGKFLAKNSKREKLPFKELDSTISITESHPGRELIIFVVGETARADHFSLNGYAKKTNPLLEKEDIVSFSNLEACGTSTAISVPCMFSIMNQNNFDKDIADATENILDIFRKTGSINLLWRDNNSNSKGVAVRIPYQDFKSPATNPKCDDECRDIGMLSGLDDYIQSHKEGDIVIVLHQMGSHGPAYYKRYPKEFSKFTPTCETGQIESCTEEEISNTYDNTILYTDYFLSKVIELLKRYDSEFESAMIYVSDHGESLGENGIYLHGLPNIIAPKNQTNPAMIMWLNKAIRHEIDYDALLKRKNDQVSHDYIFHTLLDFLEIDTEVYDPTKTLIIHDERKYMQLNTKAKI